MLSDDLLLTLKGLGVRLSPITPTPPPQIEEIMYYTHGTFKADPNVSGQSKRIKVPADAPTGIYEIGVNNGGRSSGLNVTFYGALDNSGVLLPSLNPLYQGNLPISYDTTDSQAKVISPLLDGGVVTYRLVTPPASQTSRKVGSCVKGFIRHTQGQEEEAVSIYAASGMSYHSYYFLQITTSLPLDDIEVNEI